MIPAHEASSVLGASTRTRRRNLLDWDFDPDPCIKVKGTESIECGNTITATENIYHRLEKYSGMVAPHDIMIHLGPKEGYIF